MFRWLNVAGRKMEGTIIDQTNFLQNTTAHVHCVPEHYLCSKLSIRSLCQYPFGGKEIDVFMIIFNTYKHIE